jgi:NADPH-dependent curcumin reductase CurA
MNQEIRLASRPSGMPTADNFDLVRTPMPQPGPGQVLVRNLMMSVDPYMRGRMNDVKSYVPPFQVGQALDGGAVGEVVSSNSEGLKPGDLVLHGLGWREYAVNDAKGFRKVDPLPDVSAYLGALGMPGLTAYVGLVDIAGIKEGDTVFVSGAAGAVGSIAGQIAKLRGAARVIGSAGSAAKVDWLVNDLGFDAAFNYKDGPVRSQLKAAAPEGIDVYFDNVGGEHLEAAIGALKPFGRAALCGAIAEYNNETPAPGPRNMTLLVPKRLSLQGFIVMDHSRRMPDFLAEFAPAIASGQIKFASTFVDGLHNAPDALLGLFRGENTGKMIVRL